MNARDKLKALPAYQYGYVMHLLENEGLADLFIEVGIERGRQDELWGGKTHDDEHDTSEWVQYIQKQLSRIDPSSPHHEPDSARSRMVKVAALAVAAVASMDRVAANGEPESCGNCPACRLAAFIEGLEKQGGGPGSVRVVGIGGLPGGLDELLSELLRPRGPSR